jgi:hypothetical protein
MPETVQPKEKEPDMFELYTPEEAFNAGLKKVRPVTPLLLVVTILVYASIMFFHPQPPVWGCTLPVCPTGFEKIKPQIADTDLATNGTFEGIFTNGVGTSITIKKVSVKNTVAMIACKAEVKGEYGESNIIQPADNFVITAHECGKRGKGVVYNIEVSIEYETTIDGKTSQHTDSGTISGGHM